MAQTTVTPNALASAISRKVGRTVSPKQVRGWARANLGRFDKTRHPEYQSHAYSADEVRRITAGFVARTAKPATAKPSARKPKPAAPVASDA